MDSALLVTKKDACARLGLASVVTLNRLIARGVIPGPLPGSKFLYWSKVLAGLETASSRGVTQAKLPPCFPSGPAK